MDFFNGFHQPKRSGVMGVIASALFGAVVGGVLVAVIMVRVVMPGLAQEPPNSIFTPNEDVPYNEQDRPEYQNTAIVRSAEKVVPAVVGITNKARNPFRGQAGLQEQATGTGVIIDSKGYIVTNNHVIDGAEEIWVTLGEGEELQAELVGRDAATDLAVIKIDKEGLPVAKFGNSDNIVVGEVAIAIGNPLGLSFSQSVTVGYISAKQREIIISEQTFKFIQTDAAINDGNSGGALVNLNGEIIGINTAKIKITGVEGMGFAIPANTVKNITQQLIETGRIIRPWLGIISGGNVTDTLKEQLQLPVNYGVIIAQVMPDSPANRAGLRSGDVIIQMGDTKIEDFNELRGAINKRTVGDTVEVVVIRDKQEVKLIAMLSEMPSEN